MKIKRRVVPNEHANDIPAQASPALGTEHLYSCEVSSATVANHLSATYVGNHGTVPVFCAVGSSSVQTNAATSSTFHATVVVSTLTDISGRMDTSSGVPVKVPLN